MGFSFDPSQHKINNPILGIGNHKVTITECVVVPKPNGEQIEVTFSSEGASVKAWYWLSHTNPVAQDVGNSRFASVCKAVGVNGPFQDFNVLYGKPLQIQVLEETYFSNGTDKKKSVVEYVAPVDGALPPLKASAVVESNPSIGQLPDVVAGDELPF